MLSREALDEFKKIWWEETGTKINDERALAEATRLLVFMNAIYRPLKKEWLDDEYDDEIPTIHI